MNSFYKRFKYNVFYPTTTLVSKKFGFKPIQKDSGEGQLFVVTAGRSGSTLLAGILNNHSAIHFPPEQSVLWFQINRFYGLVFEKWVNYCGFTLRRFQRIHENWDFTESDYQQINSILQGLEKENCTVSALVRTIYAHHALKHGKSEVRFLGDMTPITAILNQTVYREFPRARYLFLVRNPMDVVASNLRNPELGYGDLDKAIWRWKNAHNAFLRIKKDGYDVTMVRYEDLVSDTEKEAKRLLRWLNLRYENNMQSQKIDFNVLGVKGKKFHSNLNKTIDESQIGKSKQTLNQKQLDKIKTSLGKLMSLYGYG